MANNLFTLDIDVDGADEAASGLRSEANNFKDRRRDAMRAAVNVLHRFALRFTPVDTGRLKSSESTEASANRGTIFTNVYYSVFVEFGTRYMAAREFFGKAVSSGGQAALEAYRSILFSG